MSSFATLLVGLLAIQETIGQDITCDDCIMVVGGLEVHLSGYSSLYSVVASLASEEESILNEICPGAGLGDQDDHPNCEK